MTYEVGQVVDYVIRQNFAGPNADGVVNAPDTIPAEVVAVDLHTGYLTLQLIVDNEDGALPLVGTSDKAIHESPELVDAAAKVAAEEEISHG